MAFFTARAKKLLNIAFSKSGTTVFAIAPTKRPMLRKLAINNEPIFIQHDFERHSSPLLGKIIYQIAITKTIIKIQKKPLANTMAKANIIFTTLPLNFTDKQSVTAKRAFYDRTKFSTRHF
jgi:hypothetical protein